MWRRGDSVLGDAGKGRQRAGGGEREMILKEMKEYGGDE